MAKPTNMPLTIYNKRGGRNFKEKALEKQLQEFFSANPDKVNDFRPADTMEELKSLHDHYCIETAEIVSETKNEPTVESHESFRDSMAPEPEPEKVVNPLNRDEPIIRDYVKEDGFQQNTGEKQPQSNYSEPTNFRDSFEIPDDTIQGDGKQQQPLNANPRAKQNATPDPDAKLKRRSKKKFTKYAVDAACALAGRGIVWWATKDINNDEIQKLVVNDELSEASLNMLVYLDTNTQGTVKQFFELAIVKAQDLASFTIEEKEDLSEALEDFMEFKNIKINPTIQLGVVFLGMMFERALKAMQNKAETNSVLVQLKQIHAAGIDQRVQNVPPPAAPANEEQPVEEPAKEEPTEIAA